MNNERNEREAAIAGAQLKAFMEVTKPPDVADLFVDTCRRLRAMGATRVEGFGLVASFAPPAPASAPAPAPSEEREPDLSPPARALEQRARELAGGFSP
jgi:hypothetical protein